MNDLHAHVCQHKEPTKNSAPALFVVPPFNVTEMRHFKNHQNDGPSWLKLKIAFIILAAKMDQWWSL